MRFTACLFPLAVMADPCSRLCQIDGPSICTDGSYNKNGVCHRYLFRGDPALNDYCYHTKERAATCPSSGKPVKAIDAERLLRLREEANISPTPTTTTTTTTTTQAPVSVNAASTLAEKRRALVRRITSNQASSGFEDSVRREHVFEDSIELLSGSASNFQREYLTVQFDHQYTYLSDWIWEISMGLFLPVRGFFKHNQYSSISKTQAELDEWSSRVYVAAGRLLAVSVLRNEPLGVYFPVMFYARLLGETLTPEDLKYDAPTTAMVLAYALELEDENQLENMALAIDDELVDLNMQNREELASRMANSQIPPAERPAFELIKQGFNEVIPVEQVLAHHLNSFDLQALITGKADFDVEEFLTSVHTRDLAMGQRSMLRKVLESFNWEQRRSFFLTVTGRKLIPSGGLPMSQLLVSICTVYGLPRPSLGRRGRLSLPFYSDMADMRKGLLEFVE